MLFVHTWFRSCNIVFVVLRQNDHFEPASLIIANMTLRIVVEAIVITFDCMKIEFKKKN